MQTSEREFLTKFKQSLADPEVYLDPNESLNSVCLHGVRTVYGACQRVCRLGGVESGPLEKLFTDGFDNEDIWQEIELMNGPLLRKLGRSVKHITKCKRLQVLRKREVAVSSTSEEVDDTASGREDMSGISECIGDRLMGDYKKDGNAKFNKSVVDDHFFKLSQMEKFCNQEEEQKGSESEDEEDIDLFESTDSEREDIQYQEFFDPPSGEEEGEENIEDEAEEEEEEAEEEAEEEEAEEEGTYDDDVDLELEDLHSSTVPLSTYEKRLDKLQQSIAVLEAENMSDKSWQMSGEARAQDRPVNSLLEEVVEFEHMTRPPPTITEETTRSLEDIIRQRIIDQAWDDVERQVKPVEHPYDYSRVRPLDQEKSKQSLAEVYEQEYIQTIQGTEEKEDERHVAIKALMNKLFVKLDALSNFHFTPKPPAPEVKVVANVPAITMEEVAPISISDAALLAPEEIQEKARD